MKLDVLSTIVVAAVLTGCGSGSDTSSLRNIDYEAQVDHDEMDEISSKVRVVRVIRPELTDTTMLAHPGISAIDDKYIYIEDNGEVMAAFKFDIASGKAVDRLYRKGAGPDEYQRTAIMVYDKPTGAWHVHDYYPNKRMLTYDKEHNMIANHKVDSVYWITPSAHGGWWAVNDCMSKNGNDGMKRIIYHYDNDWIFLGSRELPSRRSDMRKTGSSFKDGVYTMNGDDYIFVNDTLMAYKPETDSFEPSIAFNLGRFTWEGNYNSREEYRDAESAGKIPFVNVVFNDSYMFMYHAIRGKMCIFDVYDLTDGRLVYRHNIPEYNISDGFPVEVDGVTMYGWPDDFVNDGHFFIVVSENAVSEATGRDESNPIIVEIELQ